MHLCVPETLAYGSQRCSTRNSSDLLAALRCKTVAVDRINHKVSALPMNDSTDNTHEIDPAAHNAVIAVFTDHPAAEAAVKKLADAGIDMKHLCVVGKGCHTDEKVIGFYNTGDRMAFWGKRGAFWGGLWGWLMGGAFLFVPVVGHVGVLGYLATVVVAAIKGAVVVGGLSALGAALFGSGIRKDSVLAYETAFEADDFLVTAHGPADEVARAKVILGTLGTLGTLGKLGKLGATRLDLYDSAPELQLSA